LVLDTSSFYKPTVAGSYPIVMATYEIVCSKYSDGDVSTAVKAFLTSALGNGQKGLDANGYIPVPDKFKTRLADAVKAIA
jgi:phosphate transport system substrate-binding protein